MDPPVDSSNGVTSANVPDWDVQDSVELLTYLDANRHRTVIRLFARRVTVSLTTGGFTIPARAGYMSSPLDLRIDCGELIIACGPAAIDLRGDDADLGWETFCGDSTSVPVGGTDGFDGGTLVINALTVTTKGVALVPLVRGGNGGRGQDGFPAGGVKSGDGGAAGNSGTCTINAGWPSSDPFPFRLPSPAEMFGVGGQPGTAGAGSPAGVKGRDGLPAVYAFSGDASDALAGMRRDAVPEGLRMRAHRLVDVAIGDWVTGKLADLTALVTNLQWLNQLGLADVGARIQQLQQLTITTGESAQGQLLAVTKDVMDAALEQLATTGTPTFAQQRPMQAAAAGIHDNNDVALDQMLTRLTSIPSLRTDEDGFYQVLDANIRRAEPTHLKGIGWLLSGLIDVVSTISDIGVVKALGLATESEIVMSEAAMGPLGIFVAAVTAVGFIAYNQYHQRALGEAAAERQGGFEEAARAGIARVSTGYSNPTKDWTINNNHFWLNEAPRLRLRQDAKNRDPVFEPPVVTYGTEFIGVVVNTEVDDVTGDRYVVLDGFLRPRISTPGGDMNALALAIVAQYRALAFLLTVKLPSSIKTPDLGTWQKATITLAPGGTGSLETVISVLDVQQTGGASPKIALRWKTHMLPPVSVALTDLQPDTALGALLTLLRGYTTVPNADVTPPAWTPSVREIAAPAATAEVIGVGQGAFCVLGVGQTAVLAVDAGASTAAVMSGTAVAYLAAVLADGAPLIISHWDTDHYCLLLKDEYGGTALQGRITVAGPCTGLFSPTLEMVIRGLASYERGLCLIGSRVAAFASAANLPNVAGRLTPDRQGLAPLFALPDNVTLVQTAKAAGGLYDVDRNNTEALAVRAGTFLLPGDASFFYIPNDAKQGLSTIEATHHGSRDSILTAAGGPGGATGPTNDIPPPSPVAIGRVIYSTNHRYSHGIELTGAVYRGKGWTTQQETVAGGAPVDYSVVLTAAHAER